MGERAVSWRSGPRGASAEGTPERYCKKHKKVV
jgi:hypothetical protein